MIEIIRTTSDNTDFRMLVTQLDQDLQIRDGEEHAFYAQFNKSGSIKHTVVAYKDGIPAGSGAFREYAADCVEIKRMFVKPEYRGLGIATSVLNELEVWAKELNYTACILETGKKQPEAIALYQKGGYSIMASYGQYKNIENSVCMKKEIK